jgi:hypothetical protein
MCIDWDTLHENPKAQQFIAPNWKRNPEIHDSFPIRAINFRSSAAVSQALDRMSSHVHLQFWKLAALSVGLLITAGILVF